MNKYTRRDMRLTKVVNNLREGRKGSLSLYVDGLIVKTLLNENINTEALDNAIENATNTIVDAYVKAREAFKNVSVEEEVTILVEHTNKFISYLVRKVRG